MQVQRIRVRRIYDEVTPEDGCRILIDRLWPRGIRREVAQIDQWPKDITPSTELRRWFHTDQSRLAEFCKRYEAELQSHNEAMQDLLQDIAEDTITLVTAVRDLHSGHVEVLRRCLQRVLDEAHHESPNA